MGAYREGYGNPWNQTFSFDTFNATSPLWINTMNPVRPRFETTVENVCAVSNRDHGFKLNDQLCSQTKSFICEMEPKPMI